MHTRVNVGRTSGNLNIVAVLAAIDLADVQVGTLLGDTLGHDTDDDLRNLAAQVDEFLDLKAAAK